MKTVEAQVLPMQRRLSLPRFSMQALARHNQHQLEIQQLQSTSQRNASDAAIDSLAVGIESSTGEDNAKAPTHVSCRHKVGCFIAVLFVSAVIAGPIVYKQEKDAVNARKHRNSAQGVPTPSSTNRENASNISGSNPPSLFPTASPTAISTSFGSGCMYGGPLVPCYSWQGGHFVAEYALGQFPQPGATHELKIGPDGKLWVTQQVQFCMDT